MGYLRLFLSSTLLALVGVAVAQDGGSTAGAARARALSAARIIPPAREVVVEDFVNYHRHEIGRPKAGEAVGMDLRWTGGMKPDEAVLQVGLSTALVNDRAQRKPLNLSLVIDKSGSMAGADKLTRVKQALQTLVGQLRDDDVLSIVVFDSEAQVALPAQAVRNRASIREAINAIEPGSSTNIDSGLVLGYKEALKRYRKDATNRVILLTDGIANQGVTNPKEIAADSLGFNDKGIDLSTIGVGRDLNEDLLRTLAKSGRGLYHFVADNGDIDKVFRNEVQSLVSPVATQPNLHVEFGAGMKLEGVYGYSPKVRTNSVDIPLDNMNSGMTEVVLLRFRAPKGDGGAVKASLSYHDLGRNKPVVKTDSAPMSDEEDASVVKNLTIARLAQGIQDMAAAYQKGQPVEALRAIESPILAARERYPNVEDEDVRRVLNTAERYQTLLKEENKERGNLIRNGDFSLGNRGFVSDLPYVAPGENVLWEGNYTVAPQWNAPLLHRLGPGDAFAAPNHPRGNEKVLYANTGRPEEQTIWSSDVVCQPHTRYRISFQSLSISEGREWIPNFEIRIGNDRSPVQTAGYHQFKEIWYEWESGDERNVTVRLVRTAGDHQSGVVAIANIEMISSR